VAQLDTGDEESIARMAKELDGVPIDLLINNAGILEYEGSSYSAVSKASFMRHFEINSVGPFLTTRALHANLKLAADAHGLAIVASVTSILGSIEVNLDGAFGPLKKVYYENHKLPNGEMYGYRASKAALNMVNANLAMNLKADNIAAVVLQPGFVKTDLNHGNGAVEPEDSIAGMAKVISGVTLEDTSKFFDFQGPELPW
jgi:NAD(P)-dependent dehydrogenase (short-subunit alcohol dehydrogenase family)